MNQESKKAIAFASWICNRQEFANYWSMSKYIQQEIYKNFDTEYELKRYPFLADLHSHLGSSVPTTSLYKLAKERGLAMSKKSFEEFRKGIEETHFVGHDDYLFKFNETQRIQSSSFAVEKSVFGAIENAFINHGLSLIEIRFNPFLRNYDKKYDVDDIIMSACIGLKKATQMFNIKAGIIISGDRSFTSEQLIILAEKASKYKDWGVIGFDVSGKVEQNFSSKKYLKAFHIAEKNGLGLTFHCGETEDYNEVFEVIDNINVSRIGHGIMSHQSQQLMEILYKRNICLEICPTSNLTTKIIPSYNWLIEKLCVFYSQGIPFTINTDGYLFLNSTLKDELRIIKDSATMLFGSKCSDTIIDRY
jgi:adenosine deaminase